MVCVADDDPLIGQAMRMILQDYSHGRIIVAATATDGDQVLRDVIAHHPHVVLMDIAMPGIDGIATTRRLRQLDQPPHVIMLTSLSPAHTVEQAIEAGAEGFVSKTDAPEDIIHRIVAVCDSVPQFNDASQRHLMQTLRSQQPQYRRDEARQLLDTLPQREREAVLLAAEGLTNTQIAARMFISERTAKAHLSSASERLCMSRIAMARLVERADLPAPTESDCTA